MKTLRVRDLQKYLVDHYDAVLQSVSYEDMLLYADFLPGSEQKQEMSILQLLNNPIIDVDVNKDDNDNNDSNVDQKESSHEHRNNEDIHEKFDLNSNLFIDIEVSCVDSTGDDIRLPPIRIYTESKNNHMDANDNNASDDDHANNYHNFKRNLFNKKEEYVSGIKSWFKKARSNVSQVLKSTGKT